MMEENDRASSPSYLDEERADAVRSMMRHAWGGYETYAWGKDELNPVSRSGKLGVTGGMNGFRGLGATLVDAMSTLHLMGLREEFDRAKEWVTTTMTFSSKNTQQVSFFETTIRLLGGLMSAHDLSGDPALLDMAEDLADRLVAVFDGHESGIATNHAQLPMTTASGRDERVLLAELGTNLIEFGSLGARTGRDEFREKAERGLRFIHEMHPDGFLIGDSVDRRTGKGYGRKTTGAPADSYYEYLLKYWIFGGKRDDYWRARWEGSADEALERLTVRVKTSDGDFAFVGEGPGVATVSHLGCFYPGNLALGVLSGAVDGEKADGYLAAAEDMMLACMQLYNTSTGLGADSLRFQPVGTGLTEIKYTSKAYIQRPEVVESLFYLWRATHDARWREMAWSIVQAIEARCRVDGGYTGVRDATVDVTARAPQYDDVQQSWFLAETLKYLFLVFEDDAKIDVERWVFNTEAHPVLCNSSSGGT